MHHRTQALPRDRSPRPNTGAKQPQGHTHHTAKLGATASVKASTPNQLTGLVLEHNNANSDVTTLTLIESVSAFWRFATSVTCNHIICLQYALAPRAGARPLPPQPLLLTTHPIVRSVLFSPTRSQSNFTNPQHFCSKRYTLRSSPTQSCGTLRGCRHFGLTCRLTTRCQIAHNSAISRLPSNATTSSLPRPHKYCNRLGWRPMFERLCCASMTQI